MSMTMMLDDDEKELLELEAASCRRKEFQSHLSEWFNYFLTIQHHVNGRWRRLKLNFKKKKPKKEVEKLDEILLVDPVTKRTWRWHERTLKDEESEVIKALMEWHRDLVDQAVPLTEDTLSNLHVTPAIRNRFWNTDSLPSGQKMSKPVSLSLTPMGAPKKKGTKNKKCDEIACFPRASTSSAPRPSSDVVRITYAGILFAVQCVANLCKTPAIGPDATSVFASLLPKSLQTQQTSSSSWIQMPDFHVVSQGILRRLRLWTSQCLKSQRTSSCWPTKEQRENAQALVSAMVVYFFAPCALTETNKELRRAEAWLEDEKTYSALREWDPPAAVKRREDEKIEETEAQKRAKARSQKMTRKQYEKAARHTKFDIPAGLEKPAVSAVSVGLTFQEAYLEDEAEEEKEQKTAEEVATDAEAEAEKNKGRFWGDHYHPAQFLNEAEALIYHIGLHEYIFLNSGGLSPIIPFTILATHKEALLDILRKEARVAVETDDWQRSFTNFVYEESVGMECKTLHRNGLLTDILNGGKKIASKAKAEGSPSETLMKEFGFKFSENMLYCSEDEKENMFSREHDLHDLFIIHFFCSTFQRYSFVYQPIDLDYQTAGVDFMGRYFIPQSMLEQYGRTELIRQRRDEERRRPLITFLRKRWMVHDFIEVEKQTEMAMKLGAKGMTPGDLKKAFMEPMEELGDNENPKAVLGVWFEFEDALEALVACLYIIHFRYGGLLEDGTEIFNLTEPIFGPLEREKDTESD